MRDEITVVSSFKIDSLICEIAESCYDNEIVSIVKKLNKRVASPEVARALRDYFVSEVEKEDRG